MLSFLSVYQPRVSCWYETIWFCWLFSVYISAPCQLLVWNYLTLLSTFPLCIFAVCMKLFDFVDFSLCIYQPRVSCCQLLVWNYFILLSFLSIYQPCVSCWWLSYFEVICFATKKFYVIFVKVKKNKYLIYCFNIQQETCTGQIYSILFVRIPSRWRCYTFWDLFIQIYVNSTTQCTDKLFYLPSFKLYKTHYFYKRNQSELSSCRYSIMTLFLLIRYPWYP